MDSFRITNKDNKAGIYSKDFGNYGINTVDKFIGVKKILFSKNFFTDKDIILVLYSQDLQRPLEEGESSNTPDFIKDVMYRELITINSVDFTSDDEVYYKYEPSNILYKKLYSNERKQSINFQFFNLDEMNYSNNHWSGGSHIEINDPFIIEFSIQ